MPLIDPLTLEDMDRDLQDLVQFFGGPLGMVPNSVRTMARRPAIARAFTELNRAVMDCRGRVTPSLKREIGYVASLAAGCRYCQAHTALGAKRFGADGARLAALATYQDSDLFTDAEKAAFDFALAAASVPNMVGAEIGAALNAHWDEGEVVEILGVVAMFGYLNRWNDSMATTLEEGAVAVAEEHLAAGGWTTGKHV